jgi:hypothetical protein
LITKLQLVQRLARDQGEGQRFAGDGSDLNLGVALQVVYLKGKL